MLITNQFPAYRRTQDWMPHETIDHSKPYVQGLIHTNTIEGFWLLLKRTLTGQHHHYSKEYVAAHIVNDCGKYNNRGAANLFGAFLSDAMKA